VTLIGPTTIYHDVFGNGDPLSGSGILPSLTLLPDGNVVRAVYDITVNGYIYGGARPRNPAFPTQAALALETQRRTK
jgi:hypothetical protein